VFLYKNIVIILAAVHKNGPSFHYMGDIEQTGFVKQYVHVSMKPTDCLTIIYTSGSSGFPKGAIISEEAYRATFPYWFESSVIERIGFSYRPLAWAADRDAAIGTFFQGGRIGFSTGDISRLMEELALVRPTQFSAPPNFWNKIYAEFKTALALANAHHSLETRSVEEEEKRLLRQFSKLIPTRCTSITVGSAKVSSTVWNFMNRCFKDCRVNNSYGITECGSVAYNNLLENSLNYRLESVPEMGYTVDDKPFPRGEILAKTEQMFSGYINNTEETRAALTDDGFFRTGDIVEIRTDSNGQLDLHVIDRKKSFFKLAQGQFVSPESLQSIYIRSPFVEQIYIHGDILADSVAAVVVPNRAYAQAFALEHNLKNFDMNTPDPKFCDAVLQDLRLIAKKESLRVHEIPSQLVIDFEPFTPENGLLTSSFKPCRHKLAAHYAARLKPVNTVDQRLKTIIEIATGQSILKDDEENFFIANGNDSLTAIRLSRLIENDLGTPIPISVLFEPTMTLQRLTTLIKNPSQISLMSHSIVPQLLNDSQLDLNITVRGHKNTDHSPSTIFITGTTGFVGAFLLAELLTIYPSNCKFICLVRCESLGNPLERIRDNMLFYRIWKEDYHERIIPLRGDLAKPYFGLDNETFESLANQTDIIFHCGATVNFVLPYSKLYGPNVCGTREIIRLATYNSICIPVQYISTISVLSSAMHKEISIDEISPDGLISGYAQSKWVAEKLITKASQLGLPVVIYRLGSICASTETGACNKNDIHTLLLAAIIKIGCYPKTEITARLNGLPANFTAKSIVYLSKARPDLYGKIYHVLNPNSNVPFKYIIGGIDRCGIQLEEVSLKEWRIKLRTINDRYGHFASAEEFFSDSTFNEGCTVSTKQFCNAVSSLNFPSLDKDYVFKWMNFILHNIVR
jgi:fatty acid CoA ligase FadD9